MHSTVSYQPSMPYEPSSASGTATLAARYQEIAAADDLHWAVRYRKLRLLGAGGEGAVYLAHRLGADGFSRPVALKLFSPEPYRDASAYHADMAGVAAVAARVARSQHDNVVEVDDFRDATRLTSWPPTLPPTS